MATMTPCADIEITNALIERLLKDQHPDLKSQPINIVDSGWDNVMARLGDHMALRLPRRSAAQALILNEQKWLPWLAPQLPLPIPVPKRMGVPTAYYPYHWTLQEWLPGQPADLSPPMSHQVSVLANFLKTLHGISLPVGAPQNSVRECPLSAKAEDIERRLVDLETETPLLPPNIRRQWSEALNEPQPPNRCFIAGDMHARNILTQNGALSAIIDWGDMCAGDPATDMMSVWGLFDDPTDRMKVFDYYGADQAFIRRAKGWAIFSGVILLHTGRVEHPRHGKMGLDVLRRVAEDDSQRLTRPFQTPKYPA